MKVLIVYHAPHCNDGFTAAWVVHNAITYKGHDPFLYPMDYGEEEEQKLIEHLNTVETYNVIYVVDFSLRLDILESIVYSNELTNIIVLDHHKTAFGMYAPDLEVKPFSVFSEFKHGTRVSITLDNGESGASLCWRTFHPHSSQPPLVEYVKDRDLYLFKHANTRAIHLYLSSQEFSISNWDRIDKEMHHHTTYQKMLAEGKRLLSIYETEVASIASYAVTCTIHHETGLMVECDGKYASDVGNALATSCGTFGLTYSEGDNRMLACSLRSKDDYDVEVLAKKFGGGGHLRAAGFKVSIDELSEAFDEVSSIKIGSTCEHGRSITDYCLHCGRTSGEENAQ